MTQIGYKTPENSSFQEFRKGCFLLPLTMSLEICKWRGDGEKVIKKNFEDFLGEGIKRSNPEIREKKLKKAVEDSVSNFLHSLRGYLNPLNPCVAVAYPLNYVWILAFQADIFNPNFKLGVIPEIKELNFDPCLYTYELMKKEAEINNFEAINVTTEEELARLKIIQDAHLQAVKDAKDMFK